MKPILNNQLIRDWDKYTQAHEPITSIDLMERAAEAAFQWIQQQFPVNKTVAILVGPGNNGGDGLAIAKRLLQHQYAVHVFCPNSFSKKSDAHNQFQYIQATFPHCLHNLKDFNTRVDANIIVDALFGTGLQKIEQGEYANLIAIINQHPDIRISLDIPSGLNADDENAPALSVQAHFTLSFQTWKRAFILPETGPLCGQIINLPIQLHPKFPAIENAPIQLVEASDIEKRYKPRVRFSHKGHYGHGLLMAGTVGKMGAALLAARAALRGGIGRLTLRTSDRLCELIPLALPEAMTEPFTHHGTPSEFHYNGWAAGCGLSTNEHAYLAFKQLLEQTSMPGIVDADALNLLSIHPELKNMLPKGSLLTPHPLEFDRLFGKSKNHAARLNKALSEAKENGFYILLKSTYSALACPNGRIFINVTGTPALAKAGSGDVLSGLLLALYAQYQNMETTALMGMYLHGLAGEIAESKCSTESVFASETADAIADAFNSLQTS